MVKLTRQTARVQYHSNPTGPGHFKDQCDLGHCERPVADEVGIRLCDRHLRKAWAAFEFLAAKDPTMWPNAEPPKRRDVTSVDAHGLVYFARVGELIKIGWTSNLQRRMSSLGADAVFHTQPGTKHDERALHAMFNHLLVKGKEWFRSDPELLNFISELH